ncbi:MAG: hypothetical protein Q9187_008284, partial [Circinaria calcarea]
GEEKGRLTRQIMKRATTSAAVVHIVAVAAVTTLANGEITDPPAHETSSTIRYAQSLRRPASPVFASPDEALFCATCLKNQHLLTQSLASYLPSITHPDYDTYEASYPKYRERLEEEYPQVCEECEPRVRERIRATGYAAKTDHLRRMMERTRGGVGSQQKVDWRHVVVYLGSIGWWAGLIGGILWDAFGTITVPNDGLRDSDETPSVLRCLQDSLKDGGVGHHCIDTIQPIANWALAISILSFWWNPCLWMKIQGRGGRMVGLSEYYKLHGLLLATRLVVIYTLRDSTGSQLSHQSLKAIHAFMVVFALVMSRVSYRAVQMDNTPLVIFQDSKEPLISEKTRRAPSTSGQVQRSPSQPNVSSFDPLSQNRLQPFPVSILAPTLQRPYNRPYQSPTPPPDDFENDAMDWTPSQKSTFHPVQPKTNILKPTPAQVQPSPFHGCLPSAPISQAHQLRNPQNQPTFHKVSSNQQQNFFNRMTNRSPKKNDDDQSGNEDNDPAAPSNFSTPGRFDMAQPRFFPQSDHRADTGLESLFTAAFSLKDEPPEVRAARELQNNVLSLQRRPCPSRTPMQRATSITLLGCACLAWSFASTHLEYAQHLRLLALGIATAVAGRGLLETFQVEKEVWRFSDIMIFVLELALAIYLGSIVKSSKIDYEATLGMVPMWLLGFMIFQETVTFAQEMK